MYQLQILPRALRWQNGELTDPGAALLRPPMFPADASIRFNLSILAGSVIIDVNVWYEVKDEVGLVTRPSRCHKNLCLSVVKLKAA